MAEVYYGDLVRDVAEASQGEPRPLLVMADWLDAKKRDPELAYALRWCAGRGRRPYRRAVTRVPAWQWVLRREKYSRFTRREVAERSAAMLPPCVYLQLPPCVYLHLVGSASSRNPEVRAFYNADAAYRSLGAALKVIREAAAYPVIAVPKVWVCRQCGTEREQGVAQCFVCLASEIKS